MRIAIIGTGFLGEELTFHLRKLGHTVVPTHHRNQKYPESIQYDFFVDEPRSIFRGQTIDAVILTAKIEFIEESARLQQSMQRFLQYFEPARIVYISSDGIFDGGKGKYTESDEPNPVTLYGRNLKLCEELVRSQVKNYCIIRPSYMYGFVGGRLDERLSTAREALGRDEQLVRFTDMFKSPLSYHQAAEVIAALTLSDFRDIVHLSGPRMSIYDFTREAMESLGVPTDRLVGELMPSPRPAGMLADTSLDFQRMVERAGITPLGIRESLAVSSATQGVVKI